MESQSILKIVLAGYSGAGKSAISDRFVHDIFDQYSPPVIGESFDTKNVIVDGYTYAVQLCEQMYGGRYFQRRILPHFCRNATVVLFCFALDDRNSFEAAQTLVIEHETVFPQDRALMILVGTKSDLVTPATRCANVEECQTYCLLHEMYYRDVSVKRNTEVDCLISFAIEKISH